MPASSDISPCICPAASPDAHVYACSDAVARPHPRPPDTHGRSCPPAPSPRHFARRAHTQPAVVLPMVPLHNHMDVLAPPPTLARALALIPLSQQGRGDDDDNSTIATTRSPRHRRDHSPALAIAIAPPPPSPHPRSQQGRDDDDDDDDSVTITTVQSPRRRRDHSRRVCATVASHRHRPHGWPVRTPALASPPHPSCLSARAFAHLPALAPY